jgi:two-component system NtrC family sensor kinase
MKKIRRLSTLKTSLSLRLLKVVFSIYLIITIIITLIQMFNEYMIEEHFIRNNLVVSQNISQQNLTAAIWNYDQTQLIASVEGILKQPAIVGIQIYDENQNIIIEKGQILNLNHQPVFIEHHQQRHLNYTILFLHQFYLNYKQQKIATVKLFSSNRVVFDKVKYNFAVIIINAVIKTIVLWILFIWAFNKFLTRQLDIFCAAMEAINVDQHQAQLLQLETFNTYELSRIEYFFNNLMSRIIDSREKLNELNKTLEQKVIDRTQQLQQAQTQLIETEKMAALGQLIAGISHEINTPIGAIYSSAHQLQKNIQQFLTDLITVELQNSTETIKPLLQLIALLLQTHLSALSAKEKRQKRRWLIEKLQLHIEEPYLIAEWLIDIEYDTQLLMMIIEMAKSSNAHLFIPILAESIQLRKNLQTILLACERSHKMVFALKSYQQHNYNTQPTIIDIVETIESVLVIYAHQMQNKIELIKQYDKHLPLISACSEELIQIWTHLIHNALQAMNYQGILIIKVETIDYYILVTIEDNGCGIAKDNQSKIFDAFFTTQPLGEGSGLGLHIVKKIVDKHQGKIKFNSQPNRTQFQVLLPLMTKSYSK